MKTINKLPFLAMLIAGSLFNSCKKDSSLRPQALLNKPVTDFSKTDSMIYTPEGWRPKSQIHLIENGYHLEIRDGHVLKIKTDGGKLVEDFGKAQTTNVSSNNTSNNSGGNFKNLNPTVPSGNGWLTWSEWQSGVGQDITVFSTNWIVPAAPSANNGQIIFIWNGIEPYRVEDNNPNNIVIQPVLQWGSNGVFGGQFWTIANWCVWGAGGAYTTPTLHITPGTNLQGLISYAGPKTDGSSNYTSQFVNSGNSMNVIEGNVFNNSYGGTIGIPYIPSMNWAYEVLEATNIYNTNDYPYQQSLIKMTNINLQVGGSFATLNWAPEINQSLTTFGEYTQIVSNNSHGSGEVDLNFHSPRLTVSYGGHSGAVVFTVVPDIPSPITGVYKSVDLATGETHTTANSPYGYTDSFTPHHTYAFTVTCYGGGVPQNEVSNTVTFTVPL